MKKALIISLSPHIGHLSHVAAYYHLFEEVGYKSTIYVLPDSVKYLPDGLDVVTQMPLMGEYEVALMSSPCAKNISVALNIKLRSNCKLIYVYHEPLGSKASFREAGVSWKKTQIIFLKDKVNLLLLKLADHIILSSKTALYHYENGIYKWINRNYTCISLIFSDEYEDRQKREERQFFSYIGTIAEDHSFREYLEFVKWAILEKRIPQIKYQIATKSSINIDQTIDALIQSGRLRLIEGKPLSNEEINNCYATSICVWNAYERTTQSGVLAKSFMFGTPAIILKKNISEFTEDGKNVVAIEDNANLEQIEAAVHRIEENFASYSTNARKRFDDCFHYKKYCDTFVRILSSI